MLLEDTKSVEMTHEGVFASLKEIFADLAEDLDLDDAEISKDQEVISVGIESIGIVYLISELQQQYQLENRVFDELRAKDRLLRDMTFDDVINAVLSVAK